MVTASHCRPPARLADGDFTAVALFREHESMLRAALGPRCDEVAAQLRIFDFKSALQTLRARPTSAWRRRRRGF